MKLLARVIDGENIVVRGQYMDAELEGDPAFQVVFHDNPVPLYEDVSSVTTWPSFGYEAGCDFKQVRAAMIPLAEANWDSLTDEEKLYAVMHFAVDQTRQLEVLGSMAKVKTNGAEYHERSTASRQFRVVACEAVIYSAMEVTEAFKLITTIKDLQRAYVSWGLEGVVSNDGAEGLFDYLLSSSGTSFEGAGLVEAGLVLNQNVSISELHDEMMTILKGEVIYV